MLPAAFAVLLASIVLISTNKAVFNFMSSGWICDNRGSPWAQLDRARDEWSVDISRGCTRIPTYLKEGVKYRITMTDKTDWSKAGLESSSIKPGPGGFWTPLFERPLWLFLLPLRRNASQPWFKPIIRLGDTRFEEFPMGTSGRSVEIIVPKRNKSLYKSDSNMYFYVNDAVIGFPYVWDVFYRKNRGTAFLSIKDVTAN
jgi:hypothetical protein